MASIAEQLIGNAQRTAENTGAGIGEGLAGLGKRIEKHEQAKQVFAQKQEELKLKQWNTYATKAAQFGALKSPSARTSDSIPCCLS